MPIFLLSYYKSDTAKNGTVIAYHTDSNGNRGAGNFRVAELLQLESLMDSRPLDCRPKLLFRFTEPGAAGLAKPPSDTGESGGLIPINFLFPSGALVAPLFIAPQQP